jgi:hypothetical protein
MRPSDRSPGDRAAADRRPNDRKSAEARGLEGPAAPPRPPPLVLEVDPGASAMLDLLVELGHLDDRLLNLVNDRLLDLAVPNGRIGIQELRKVAAEVIFEQEGTFDAEFQRVVNEEWGLLFY